MRKPLRSRLFRYTLLGAVLPASLAFAASYAVQWQGSLQAVHGGDVSGKVPLQQFAGKKNLYAVGPAADLDGEVTAIDGQFHIARVRHGEVTAEKNPSGLASFLVWSEVAAWRAPVALGAAQNHAQLEARIEALAAAAGVDLSRPFPFRLEGKFDSIDYHVLVPRRAPPAGAGHGAAKAAHGEGQRNIAARQADAVVVGFFSRQHEGVFTHRGSTAHMHVLEPNGRSGHVDELSAGSGVRVFLPQ